MDFKSALQHYKDGSATGKERDYVEQELEIFQSISEYLDEQWDVQVEQPEYAQAEFQQVKRGVRKSRIYNILISVGFIAALLLVAVVGIIPNLEGKYWDPAVSTYSDAFTDLEFTMRTFSELFIPNQQVCDVKYLKSGFASYDLSLTFRSQHNRTSYTNGTAALVRNQTEFPEGTWNYPQMSNFYLDLSGEGSYYFRTAESALQSLPDYVKVWAYVTFPRDLSMEEFADLNRRVGSSELESPGLINWVGIRIQKDGKDIYPLCGMKPFYGNDREKMGEINQAYPCYSIFNLDEPLATSEAIKEHFKSILQYASDQAAQGTGLLPDSEFGEMYYQDALHYVEENGIYTYGCSVISTPRQLLELMHDGTVCAVSIQDAWISF